jgi:hypothetical protein
MPGATRGRKVALRLVECGLERDRLFELLYRVL